jgi:hypothetical protein
MKKVLVYFVTLIVFSSCKTTLFDALPGETQKQFPANLQGSYYLKVPTSFFKRSTDKDTLFFDVLPGGYSTRDSAESHITMLNNTNKLQLVGNKHLVLANQNSEYKKYWELVFIEPTKQGIKLMYVVDDEKSTVLPGYFARNFVAVNNAGDSIFAYKTNDSLLVQYYEKVLRKKDALELIRITQKESKRDSI